MSPEIDRNISPDEARLADAGCRNLFNKPLSDLISNFERVNADIPVSFFEMLVKVGARLSKDSVTAPGEVPSVSVAPRGTGTTRAVTLVTVHQRAIIGMGALLAALRLFVPIQVWEYPTGPEMARAVVRHGYEMVQRVLMGPTLLQVLGIAAVTAAFCVVFPSLPKDSNGRSWVIALEVGLTLAVLGVILS